MCIYYSRELLVPDVPARHRTIDPALPRRIQHRRNRRHGDVGTIVRDAPRPARCDHRDDGAGHRLTAIVSARHRLTDAGSGRTDDGLLRHGHLGYGARRTPTSDFPPTSGALARVSVITPAAAIGAFMPFVLGALQDRGFALVNAMSAAMVLSGLTAMIIWLGPETRGSDIHT